MVRKARDGKLAVSDFQGTTMSLTNPGGIGTVHSVPRLMAGQGAIIGVGAMEYPPEWQGGPRGALKHQPISQGATPHPHHHHPGLPGRIEKRRGGEEGWTRGVAC